MTSGKTTGFWVSALNAPVARWAAQGGALESLPHHRWWREGSGMKRPPVRVKPPDVSRQSLEFIAWNLR
jgi:hypothetical protein